MQLALFTPLSLETGLTYEVLEAVGSEMHVGHQAEQPNNGVADGLLEARHDRGVSGVGGGVELHAVVGEITLLRSEPLGGGGEVGEDEVSDHRDHEGHDALEDEEPLPAGDAAEAVHAVEDTGSDESGKSGSQDVSGVEDGNASGNLLSVVEDGEDVHGAGVEGGLSETEEETSEQEADEVLGEGGQSRDDGPEHHDETHVPRRTSSGQEHVAGNLTEDVADEEDGNAGLVLGVGEVEVLLEVVQAGQGDGIAIYCWLGLRQHQTMFCDIPR